jgi:hypothetical protein
MSFAGIEGGDDLCLAHDSANAVTLRVIVCHKPVERRDIAVQVGQQKVAFCLECLCFSVDFWQHPGLSPKQNYGCELFRLNILSRKEKDNADDDAHEYHP